MKAPKFLLSFLFFGLAIGISVSSFGKTFMPAYGIENVEQSADKDFQSFLGKFTTSAVFQYSRIKFPLETPIILLTDNGDEKTFPFTKEKWPLLDSESFKIERVAQEDGSVYVAKFVVDEAAHKEYEAGYEESELDLRVVFNLIDGKWYVTDCYNSWYNYDLAISELKETIRQVQEENNVFKSQYP